MLFGLVDENGEFKEGAITKLIIIVAIIAFTGITAASAFGQVPSGYRGVKLEFGKNVGTINEGLYFKVPYMHTVELMSVQIQKAESIENTVTADLQEVSTTVAVNYHLDPLKVGQIYTDLRHDYANRVIKPNIEEALKATTALYTAEELITVRADVKAKFDVTLHDRLDHFGIVVDAVSLTDFEFSASYRTAIDAKVEQEQIAKTEQNRLLTIEYTAQQQVIQANAEAEVQLAKAEAQKLANILEAEGESMALAISAEAQKLADILEAEGESQAIMLVGQAEADAIRARAQVLDAEYLQLALIEAWANGGMVPEWYMGDEGAILDILIDTTD